MNYCYIISLILIIHICLFGECFSKCKCIIYIYISAGTLELMELHICGSLKMFHVLLKCENFLFVNPRFLFFFSLVTTCILLAKYIYIYTYITILCICSLVKLLFKEICRTHRHTHNLYDRQNHAFQSKCPHTTIY